jgi:sarcosine oxidase subunit gamma
VALKRNGLTIAERKDIAVTHIALRRGMRADLEARASATLGVTLPWTPRVVEAAGKIVVWAGPEQWLVVEPRTNDNDPSAALASAFKGIASVVDVSDSRAMFRVTGPKASEVLSTSMGIDFHTSAFTPGDVAITHVSHLGVIVWRLADGQSYDFACPRTFSADFSDWLAHACAR